MLEIFASLERFGDGFDPLSGRAIDDAGLVLADQRVQAFVFLRFVRDRRDEQFQIRPRESRDELPRLAQTKMRQDIAAHFGRRRRREGGHLGPAERLEHLIEPEIIGPKIVAPHREAMRFIHREKRDGALAQRFQKRPAAEAFRRDVDKLELAPRQRPDPLALLRRAERAVDQRRGNAAALERIDLVLHQRDQGRDHHGGSLEEKRRELIAERFAAARRHHHQRIGATGDGGDHFFLRVEKFSETEIFFENFVGGHVDHRLCRMWKARGQVRAQGGALSKPPVCGLTISAVCKPPLLEASTRPRTARRALCRRRILRRTRPQQFLNFFPLPQGHGSLRPTFGTSRRTGARSSFNSEPSPLSETFSLAAIRSPWRPGTGPVAVGALGACSRRRNCGRVERKFSKACKFDVLRKRLCSTSFLMFAISSTNMS